MKQHTKNAVNAWGAFLVWLALIVVVMLALALTSCTKRVYVPVERAVTQIEYRDADTTALMNRWRSLIESMRQTERTSDSVVDREKETVTLNDKGDTIGHYKERNTYVSSKREKELEHVISEKNDTIKELRTRLASVKVDSVYVEKPIKVERNLTKWEQTKMDFGAIGMVLIVVALVTAIGWLDC